MVMLDFCCQFFPAEDLIVAHFNHGMRDNAMEDQNFVEEAAKSYGLNFVCGNAKLGKDASENLAREKRYGFLNQIAKENSAEIYTAHHLDDLAETVAINFIRGTGWRGLACFGAPNIRRLFLETEHFYEPLDKSAIFEYAAKRGLKFREDQSNSELNFLRNRVREKLNLDFDTKLQIYHLWRAQKALRQKIEQLISELLPDDSVFYRDWFKNLDCKVAIEILRAALLNMNISLTRPQLDDFLNAVCTYKPGKKFNLPEDRLVKLNKETFSLK